MVHYRELQERSQDIFEATIVAAKRARQIIAERISRNEILTFDREAQMDDSELEEEIERDYVEMTKATTEALDEFISGELEWSYGADEKLTA